jgi:hypothetical protein
MENDILSTILVWDPLPHISLHCWKDDALKCIRNSLRHYIDGAEPKENMSSCAHIYVKVDLEKGIPEVVLIFLENWNHIQ